MKYKFLALSLVLASSLFVANAQEKEECQKKSSNIYVGAGIGAMSVINSGLNSPTLNLNIKVGKYITPVWGIRAEVAGLWQSLETQEHNYYDYCKKFVEFNLDGTLSLTNLFMKYDANRKLNVYAFAGPTMNISSAVSATQSTKQNIEIQYPNIEQSETSQVIQGTVNKGEPQTERNYKTDGAKARIGATAGLGIDFNLNNKWAINVESRFGVSPSIFGWGSDCRTAEATGRLTIGAKYTFNGVNFCKPVSEKTIEKIVEKEVIKEVPVEIIKEIIKEVPAEAAAAIFFKIGKSEISEEGMVNIKLMAKTMKANPTTKYKVAGFADKGTGSVAGNQTLSEKRAQAVYDALIAEGIEPERLEKIAMGGVDPLFEKAHLTRVVILETK
jgi:OOP family OmpA-OmpF porin